MSTSNTSNFTQSAGQIGSGIGNFLGGVVNPVLGTTQTTSTTTKPKDNTTVIIAVVVIVVIVGAYFLLRKPKTA